MRYRVAMLNGVTTRIYENVANRQRWRWSREENDVSNRRVRALLCPVHVTCVIVHEVTVEAALGRVSQRAGRCEADGAYNRAGVVYQREGEARRRMKERCLR